MKYIVLPIEDAKIVFSEEELNTMRRNVADTEVLVHEEILLRKREALGMSTLPVNEDGTLQWTYPVYEYNSQSLNGLLSSAKWSKSGEKRLNL